MGEATGGWPDRLSVSGCHIGLEFARSLARSLYRAGKQPVWRADAHRLPVAPPSILLARQPGKGASLAAYLRRVAAAAAQLSACLSKPRGRRLESRDEG